MAKNRFVEITLHAINVVFSLFSVSMVILGVVFFLKWKRISNMIGHTLLVDHPLPKDLPDLLPDPSWFIYMIFAIGGTLFLISCLGYAGTATRSPCCLLSYSIFLVTLVLVELGTTAFIYFKKNWKYVMPSDRLGLHVNWSIVSWVALGILILQAIAMGLGIYLRAVFARDSELPLVSIPQKERSKRAAKKPKKSIVHSQIE